MKDQKNINKNLTNEEIDTWYDKSISNSTNEINNSIKDNNNNVQTNLKNLTEESNEPKAKKQKKT